MMTQFLLRGGPLGHRLWLFAFVPGALSLLLGILIAINPDLLITLVSGVLVLLGLILVSVGLRLRAAGKMSKPWGS
jgi:hypothetical protein|nr:hypothetical protein [Planctomycetota bacterium]